MTGKEFDYRLRKLYLPLGMDALRFLDDAQNAADIVENCFMIPWQAIDEGKDILDFQSYMYRSVRNACISFIRNRKETVGLENIPEADEEAVDTSERDAAIWKAIDQLPEKCREVFLLSKRDGLSNEEIADQMGISIKTVKNQMTKAFSRLRESLSSGHRPFFLPFL